MNLAQKEMKTPQCEKLFFLASAERPKEGPEIALEKKIFERGVVMDCWKKLQNQFKANGAHNLNVGTITLKFFVVVKFTILK